MKRSFLVVVLTVVIAACSSSSSKPAAQTDAPTTTAVRARTPPQTAPGISGEARPLRVLVTNDDGVHAPGIDAVVEALRVLPEVAVTVVAPATNQSGTESLTTKDPAMLVTDKTTTASGYPAIAVHGFPADTIVWAIDRHGVAQRPDVVVSGVNNGQNIGAFVDLSGTVGAARAAARRGIPALAVSAGLGAHPDFADGAHAAVAWLSEHVGAMLIHRLAATVTNINVPTCPTGSPRPTRVIVPIAPKTANAAAPVDCITPHPKPTNDVDGFVHGYMVESDNLSLTG